MKNTTRSTPIRVAFVIVAVFTCWLLAFSTDAEAQSQGNNAVYNSSGICSSSTLCGFSGAFIDASTFASSFPNICAILHGILIGGSYPAAGAVIDARGLNSSITSMQCTASPWSGITSPPPSKILLPAGTILIPTSWILPANTHLIGEGDNPSSATLAAGTTIQACKSSTCAFSGTMIQFGSSSATGISVENVTLDGQGLPINGIVNQYSGYLTYVDRVMLFRILGTGLAISGAANNSGPYSNITFDLNGDSGTSQTVCVSINGLSSTHGVRGLTCIANSPDPPAAVLLDSSNNSIEDVRIVGFYDGIRVGANNNAQSNPNAAPGQAPQHPPSHLGTEPAAPHAFSLICAITSDNIDTHRLSQR